MHGCYIHVHVHKQIKSQNSGSYNMPRVNDVCHTTARAPTAHPSAHGARMRTFIGALTVFGRAHISCFIWKYCSWLRAGWYIVTSCCVSLFISSLIAGACCSRFGPASLAAGFNGGQSLSLVIRPLHFFVGLPVPQRTNPRLGVIPTCQCNYYCALYCHATLSST